MGQGLRGMACFNDFILLLKYVQEKRLVLLFKQIGITLLSITVSFFYRKLSTNQNPKNLGHKLSKNYVKFDTVKIISGNTLKGDLDCQHVCFSVVLKKPFVFLF